MTTGRIKEIQSKTAYPDSISVYKALMQVWNECEQEQLRIHDVSGSFIQELAKEHINKCKDACYSSGSFAGNELEGDYGSWRDWEARLILFGRELLKNCL